MIHREGNMVAFDVSDDGPGIAPGEQQNVFGKFYKVGSTSANALKGCGLGLYVVQQIAKAHHGTCRMLSQSPSTLRLAIPTYAAKGA